MTDTRTSPIVITTPAEIADKGAVRLGDNAREFKIALTSPKDVADAGRVRMGDNAREFSAR